MAKTSRYEIRLGEAQKKAYSEAAALSGVEMADWIRFTCDREIEVLRAEREKKSSLVREGDLLRVSRLKGEWEPR